MDKEKLIRKLEQFTVEQGVNSKGPLCVVLVMTRKASNLAQPYSPEKFLTPKGGQVAGLSRSMVQNILGDYGISRVLAEEGGRTSRGSMSRMKAYLELLNDFYREGLLDFTVIEKWWIDQVKAYFAAMPLKLRPDPSQSLRRIISELIEAATIRQRECQGTMVVGAVMEHLVGAKLTISLSTAKMKHKGFSVADAPGKRKGDFVVGDAAIHVTTSPTEALIRKCVDNLVESLRPIIITTQEGIVVASALAKDVKIDGRIDLIEIVQFLSANILEWSEFKSSERPTRLEQLVTVYNRIIDQTETDPSLKIALV
jgi:hypothetical protein